MEGVNLGGILLVYAGLLLFGITSLSALGILLIRRTTAALIVFATGFFLAAIIIAGAILTFLDRQFRGDTSELIIVMPALTFFLAGTGQFIAALRGPRTYAVAFICAMMSLLLITLPMLDGTDVVGGHLGLAEIYLYIVATSSILASASLIVAVFFRLDRPVASIP